MAIRRAYRPRAVGLLLAALGLSVGATAPSVEGVEGARLVAAKRLGGDLFHVQGMALDGGTVWITSVDRQARRAYLQQFDRATGVLLRRLDLTDGVRFHPGGISITDRSIWVPVAELRPHSSAVLVEVDADSGRIRRRIAVDDHLGCVAASGHRLVAGNWDSRRFHIFDLTGREAPRIVVNPSPTRYQDIKFVDGRIVAGGYRTWWSGAVEWLDWPTLRVVRTVRAGPVGPTRAYTGEGMAIEGRDLYLAPEDGVGRLFRFRLDA